jgi:hypothetical protein
MGCIGKRLGGTEEISLSDIRESAKMMYRGKPTMKANSVKRA